MAQVVNTNLASINAQRNLAASGADNATALERLSSGLRINSAADDAAGLAISTRLDSQIRGTAVAIRNAGDGISLAQTADGALGSVNDSLQRIRELAVQSANSTNTDLDRASLQAEVDQLIEEIGNVTSTANFNGLALFDGSLQNSSFQTGTNVGDTIEVSIGDLSTQNLGSAATAGLTGNVSTTGIADNAAAGADGALVAGDLVINGVAVAASEASADTASSALEGSSAISRAAAINAVSDQTGVTATAAPNTAQGSVLANAIAVNGNTADFSINGVAFSFDVADAGDATETASGLGQVAAQINAQAGATGVSAEVVQVDTGFRIDLTAADGRNIAILDGDANGDSAAVGLAVGAPTNANVFLGNVTLNSVDGSDITLSTTTGDIDNAGFEVGTFSGALAQSVGDNGDDSTRAALQAGDLLINGTNIGITLASDDNASTGSNAASGIALAASINRSSDVTGVSATVNATTVNSTAVAAGASALTINGVALTIADTTGGTVGETLSAIITGVNASSGQTGVRAEALDGDQFTLIADDGRNIVTAGPGGTVGIAADTFIAGVTLEAAGQFTVDSATANIARSGLTVGTFGGAESGTSIASLDITTVEGANEAIVAIDNAVNQVSTVRANLGAVQNRFEATISNLQITSENLSATNSSILDADFAAETAALSRSSVLQQAGISILAQANAAPNAILSLLG